jgi:hypothetical protein
MLIVSRGLEERTTSARAGGIMRVEAFAGAIGGMQALPAHGYDEVLASEGESGDTLPDVWGSYTETLVF